MESAKTSVGDHSPHPRLFHRSPGRRVSAEGHVRAVLVVEPRVLASAAQEMTFAEHDEVVGELTPKRPDKPFRVAGLPMAIAA